MPFLISLLILNAVSAIMCGLSYLVFRYWIEIDSKDAIKLSAIATLIGFIGAFIQLLIIARC